MTESTPKVRCWESRRTFWPEFRRELGIDDDDQLRWHLNDDGSARGEVIQQQTGTFAEFDGYDSDKATDVTTDHDAWGVDGE